MNYNTIYEEAIELVTTALSNVWIHGNKQAKDYIKYLLTEEEPVLNKPVFQTIFPWECSSLSFEDCKSNLLKEDFVDSLSNDSVDGDYKFPLDRHPYKHQLDSWKAMIQDKKTIVVTTGTGSGKTECFMLPVLHDLYNERLNGNTEGVQAIFIYPLNALMNSQEKRIRAWCSSLPNQVTYSVYNGETPRKAAPGKSVESSYPKLESREEIRATPPQILFTNPTMLNYMLVRDEDQQILQKSKGKLRWILLDEAHTYTGSSAAELSLQIRRIIDAFNVRIEDVNFAVTSATIGDGKDENKSKQLISFISQLTGKSKENIHLVTGQRIVPELNQEIVQDELNVINKKFHAAIDKRAIDKLREHLNNEPALNLDQINDLLGLSLSTSQTIRLIDSLGEAKESMLVNGHRGALLPTRAHFFIRSIKGLYVCTNPDCTRHEHHRISLGSLTTFQNMSCTDCGEPLLELASCSSCGELFAAGILSEAGVSMSVNKSAVKNPITDYLGDDKLDGDEDDDINNELEEEKKYDVQEKKQIFFSSTNRVASIVSTGGILEKFNLVKKKLVFTGSEDSFLYQRAMSSKGEAICTRCGEKISLGKADYFRASASFISQILSGLLLSQATASGVESSVYGGRKYITFTDSRQGTAISAMKANQDIERYWIRKAIFHYLCSKRRDKAKPTVLTEEEMQKKAYFEQLGDNIPPFFLDEYNRLKKQQEGNFIPENKAYSWNEIQASIDSSQDCKRLFDHFVLTSPYPPKSEEKGNYLKALFIDQFGWIPKRDNSLENMGLIELNYPALKYVNAPTSMKKRGFDDEDWRDYLKICIDYFIRVNRFYKLPEDTKIFLTQRKLSRDIYDIDFPQTKNARKPVWPQLKVDKKVSERQNRIVLLLCAALGLHKPEDFKQEDIDFVNFILKAAWDQVKSNVLEKTGDDEVNHRYYSYYRLHLLDEDKVKIKLVDKAWLCPVDNVFVNTLLKGYSPRIKGYLNAKNFERFKVNTSSVKMPYFPYANRVSKDDCNFDVDLSQHEVLKWMQQNLSELYKLGIMNNLYERIYSDAPIFLAAEHSAQQEPDMLRKYESKFNEGKINILSCSTTMEMGVDIGGISQVVMNTVPPKAANYLQRVGRAGRRSETKAMALTICPPTPIGINSWENPTWPMTHSTEMPNIKLESVQLIQRHINALLFGQFIIAEGGVKLSVTISDFFKATGDEVASLSNRFMQWLTLLIDETDETAPIVCMYQNLVRGSSLETNDFSSAVLVCRNQLGQIKRRVDGTIKAYEDKIQALITLDKHKAQQDVLKANKDKFLKIYLIGFLAETNFLPSAGIPIGLVDFNPNVNKKSNIGKQKNPTMHISQAISNYAPGQQIVINEWNYESHGVVLKTPYQDSKRQAVQVCRECGYATISVGEPYDDCPSCGQKKSMGGVNWENAKADKFTEVVEPAGFASASDARPKRTEGRRDFNFIQPVLLNMPSWSRKTPHSKITFRQSNVESEILYFNTGQGLGYAYCPYCGRLKAERLDSVENPSDIPMPFHKDLQTGKKCPGGDGTGKNLRRRVILSGRYQTDFIELHFYDANNQLVIDKNTLFTLGVVLSRKLTELLGINDNEIDFGYNERFHSIFIYDTALGGAGYSPLLRQYAEEVLKMAYDSLKACSCERSCIKCLIDRKSQWYLDFLDRHAALQWLSMQQEFRNVSSKVAALLPNSERVYIDIVSELYNVISSPDIQKINFFVSDDFENWDAEVFALSNNIRQLQNQGVDINFVLPNSQTILNCTTETIADVLPLMTLFSFYSYQKTMTLIPVFEAVFSDGRIKGYFSDDVVLSYNESWGKGDIYKQTVDSEIVKTKIETEQVLNVLAKHELPVFEFYLNSDASTHTLWNEMTSVKSTEWSTIKQVLHNKKVNISYADRYLVTPLACYMLVHLVNTMKCDIDFEIATFTIQVSERMNGYRDYPDYLDLNINEDFSSCNDRRCFLEECFDRILPHSDCKVEDQRYIHHHRVLKLSTEDYTISLRPDGGIGFGWKSTRTSVRLVEDLLDDLHVEISLYNNQKKYSKGVLYTCVTEKEIK